MTERWVSRRYLADHLNVSKDKVDELVSEGMPSLKLADAPNGARRFKVSACEQWLRERHGNFDDDEVA